MIAAGRLEANHDAALDQWRLEVERRRYEASKAERRYQAVDPDNRLVARGLEAQWEQRLRELGDAEAEMERRQRQQPRNLSDAERQSLLALGGDLQRVWAAPTTTDRDRKELLRTLLEDVTIAVERAEYRACVAVRWRSGDITRLEVALPRSNPPTGEPMKKPSTSSAAWPSIMPMASSLEFSIARSVARCRETASPPGTFKACVTIVASPVELPRPKRLAASR